MILSILLAIVVAAVAPPVSAQTLDDVLEWVGILELEETEDALNALPRVSADPRGGFLVADQQEQQVRTYDSQGRLIASFGREGEGPREFQGLTDVTRLASGDLAALTNRGKLSIWTSEGEQLLETVEIPGRMWSVGAMGSGIAMAGVPILSPEEMTVPVVRVLSEEGQLEKELVYPHITEGNAPLFGVVVGPTIEGLGSEKAVTAPVVDTIWVVDSNTTEVVRKVPIPSQRLESNEVAPDSRRGMEGFREWLFNTWFVEGAYPLSEGGWLVTLWKSPGPDAQWALLKLDDRGNREWEVGSDSGLATVDVDERLIFAEPTGIIPNQFRIGRLKN